MPNIRDKADASVILNDMRKGNLVATADTHIKWIKSTGAKMDATIHAVAVAAIHASMPIDAGGFLNADVAARLMNAMPKGSRAKALAAWFEAFSNIFLRLEKTGLWTAKMIGPDNQAYKEADPVTAFQKPFWSVEEGDGDPKAFLLGAALAKIIKAAQGKNAVLSDADREALKAITTIAEGLTGPVTPKADPTPKDAPVADVGAGEAPVAPLMLTGPADPMEVSANA